MEKNSFNIEKSVLFSVIAVFLSLIALLLIAAAVNFPNPEFSIIDFGNLRGEKPKDIKKFSSEQDFKNYLAASSGLSSYYGGLGMDEAIMKQEAAPRDAKSAIGAGIGEPQRVSETNVQVIGIDEPDIVKTDGKEIYFSSQPRFYPGPLMRGQVGGGISLENQKMIMPPYPIPAAETKAIKAFPQADLAIDGKIDKQGDLLLDKNILMVFSGQEINGYDISNPKYPVKRWNVTLNDNNSIISSRLYDDKVYLITRSAINESHPCPFAPISGGGSDMGVAIRCQDIYHPIIPVPADSTFIVMVLDPNAGGKIEKTISFIGSSGSSIVYVSENAIYASYIYNESIAKFFSGFIRENNDLFPSWLAEKAIKLEEYDISENSKLQEIATLIEKYNNSLSDDEKLKAQNEMTNQMAVYYKLRNRDLEKTGIVKIDLNKLQVAAVGTIPGHLLNNFAMDEYDGNLRVASTIGSRRGIFSSIGISESVSDVYILDKNLKTISSLRDLGKTEQIYSVRFIEDKGYIVTFQQADPFYVLDLANPKNPAMAGELKIPGYSSYLHPLDATHILGIGQESSQVKISLFDVADKNNPVELDKYLLDEYWSEVANNYHAFLLDKKHNIFFLPGSKGGYVFFYGTTAARPGICKEEEKNNCSDIIDYRLELKKAISQNSVKRAIYINDYLYIIGEDKITVLNEIDWKKVNEMNL